MEERASSDRSLPSAQRALDHMALGQPVTVVVLAMWTHKTTRPTMIVYGLETGSLGIEPALKIHEID